MNRLTSVLLLAGSAVTLLDPSSGTAAPVLREVARIPLPMVHGRIDHFAVDLEGRRLFVAALGNRTVEVIDLARKQSAASISGFKEPQGLLYLPASRRLIVTDGQSDRATVIDTRTMTRASQIALLEDGDNVRLDAKSGNVWIGAGGRDDAALVEVAAASGKVMSQVKLRGHPESLQLQHQGTRIFVNVPSARVVEVVDREAGRIMAEWPVPEAANFPMALDEAGQRLFVVTRSAPRLLIYDAQAGKVVASLPAVGDADDVFFDATRRTVYVSGGGGQVQVFQEKGPDDYRLEQTIPTAKGARTSLFVPEWNTLFAAVPRSGGQQAEIRMYEAAP